MEAAVSPQPPYYVFMYEMNNGFPKRLCYAACLGFGPGNPSGTRVFTEEIFSLYEFPHAQGKWEMNSEGQMNHFRDWRLTRVRIGPQYKSYKFRTYIYIQNPNPEYLWNYPTSRAKSNQRRTFSSVPGFMNSSLGFFVCVCVKPLFLDSSLTPGMKKTSSSRLKSLHFTTCGYTGASWYREAVSRGDFHSSFQTWKWNESKIQIDFTSLRPMSQCYTALYYQKRWVYRILNLLLMFFMYRVPSIFATHTYLRNYLT